MTNLQRSCLNTESLIVSPPRTIHKQVDSPRSQSGLEEDSREINRRRNVPLGSDKLDECFMGFRTALQNTIGCTPSKLVSEKACLLPGEARAQSLLVCPDCEDSRALSFAFHPQEFHILSFILGIQYPNLID
ncbi:hypothetical protein Tco_0915955 [Tanacetum coccineum]